MIRLRPAREFRFPIIAECISPDVLEGKSACEIEELKIWEGNRQKKLRELFTIDEVRNESKLESVAIAIHGDVSKVRRIGSCMKSGEIVISGDAGMHLGEEMKGGKITVHGNVGAWLGSMMSGGTIEVHGNASDYVGAPYRGSTKGMHGGKMTIYGNVGNEVGAWMKKGTIKVYGSAGQFVGFRMRDGTIYVQDDCEARAGACMTDGKIVAGGCLQSVLPSFTIDSVKPRVKIEENETVEGPFYLFLGDLAEGGKGKLYVFKDKNPHLTCYEKFI
jgi:formylmethanofuran dehydrogenase subunit C